MLTRRAILPLVIGLLIYGFWLSPDFKQISAGVAIFLLGMMALEDGFRAFAGGVLDNLMRRSTDQLWKSLTFGMVSTTVVQSSSLISLLTISFLSSGLITLGGAIGIVFGANLGTTTGAWLVAGLGLKVSLAGYAMPMLVIGVLLLFQKDPTTKGAGSVLLGIGFLFLGIDFMKQGFETFRDSIDLSRYSIEGLAGLLIYTAIGLAATVIMQSSHAVLVLILAALAAGQISYENALALAIGSNVGTTITAIIGSLGANQDGKRLAAAHFVFNVSTGAVALIFIGEFRQLVEWLAALMGLADDTLKLAIFHTLFNITGLLLMLPFTGKLERTLANRFHAPSAAVKQPRFLNEAAKQYPDTAVEAVRNETVRLYEIAEKIIAHAMSLHRTDLHSERDLREVVRNSRKVISEDINEKYALNVKALYSSIMEFISDVVTAADGSHLEALQRQRMAGARIVEALKAIKHLQKNLLVHITSRNPVIREQYDTIRILIGETLRAIDAMKNSPSEDVTILSYDEARLALARADIVADGTLDGLIRNRQISATVAISLMNDYGYAQRACSNLLGAAEILFLGGKGDSQRAEAALSLDEDEIAKLAHTDDAA